MLFRGVVTAIASAALIVSTFSVPAVATENDDDLTVDASVGEVDETRTIDEPEWRDDAAPEVVPEPEELTEEQAQYEAHLRLQAEKITGSDAEAERFDETEVPEESADAVDESDDSSGELAPGEPGDSVEPAPDAPATEAPGPETEAPSSEAPETDTPATDVPASEAPETSDAPDDGEVTSGPAMLDSAVKALSGSSFTAGNLIINDNFYNGSAMSEAQIQAFLQKQVGSCKNSNCLASYKATTPTRTWSWGTCSKYTGGSNESAARIIYKVQKACNLSAKVILVTLQKEQGLITDPDPTDGVMRKAMGYGCPDTDVCDSTYYGFFNQVFAAGRQLTWYGDPNGSFTWIKVGGSNSILYHPDASRCGSGTVTVQNRATAALYYYTPYQPNRAALGNLYGTGDSCSAYGNRNFWRMYSDWFGDPRLKSNISTVRLSGADRYATAVSISKNAYPSAGVGVVYVASGEDFPDALSAAPAAAAQGGPLLLTKRSTLPSSTLTELKRLKPKRIVIVGATGVITSSVASKLAAVAPVKRLGGSDRYATSRLVAEYAFPDAGVVYVATGRGYADAMSAGGPAGASDSPVLLIDGAKRTIDSATFKTLSKIGADQVRLAGGTGVISSSLESSLKSKVSVKRYQGSDRYGTNAALIKSAFPSSGPVYIASGTNFPDALSGAAASGAKNAPLVITRGYCLTSTLSNFINSRSTTQIRLLGGSAVVASRVGDLAKC